MAQLKETTIQGNLHLKGEGVKIYVNDTEFQGGSGTDIDFNNPEFIGSLSMGRIGEKAEGSVALGENVQAIGNNSVSLGKDNIAGCKGYYIKSIDLVNKKIYLCNEKVLPEISTDDNTDTTFETPGYEVEDKFTIKNGRHYILCAAISDLINNSLSYNGDLGFTEIAEDTDINGYSIIVPSKPLIGNATISINSYAEGENTSCPGQGGHTEGYHTVVVTDYGHAEGYNTESWYASHAEGLGTKAKSTASHAEGYYSKALRVATHAEGNRTVADGNYAHAEGDVSKALGVAAHAEGGSTASGNYSHSEGGSAASGDYSHAEGYLTEAIGKASHSEGLDTIAEGNYSHAEGYLTEASGENSHAEGDNTKAIGGTSHAEGYESQSIGIGSHTEGYKNTAIGAYSHAEGNNTIATGLHSHSEGYFTEGKADYSHAEGFRTCASGVAGHAEGCSYEDTNTGKITLTTADGEGSHAENIGTTASGKASHSEGILTESTGQASHAEGYRSSATGNYSHAEGNYCDSTEQGSHSEGIYTTASGKASHSEGYETTASGANSHVEGYKTTASNTNAHAEGSSSIASGENSHAEGHDTDASGYTSHAEGYNTDAKGQVSHAEGAGTVANDYAHAEGLSTKATGYASHSEGQNSKAISFCSHAEGYNTEASGEASHVEGWNNIAKGHFQHVEGKFNISDTLSTSYPNGKYAHILGNGTSSTRSNAHTVDWSGNAWYAGKIQSDGEDYAEYFEWQDGNLNNEDRVGLLVTLDGENIKLANDGDEVLGIISGTVAVLGGAYECLWQGRYLTDDFGRIQYEEVEEFYDKIVGYDEETNEPVIETKSLGFFKHPKFNPDYDPTKEYINRADRQEWDAVGMLGKLYVRDDGTCIPNYYATVGENGVATSSLEKTNMRVLSRINDNVVRVLLK